MYHPISLHGSPQTSASQFAPTSFPQKSVIHVWNDRFLANIRRDRDLSHQLEQDIRDLFERDAVPTDDKRVSNLVAWILHAEPGEEIPVEEADKSALIAYVCQGASKLSLPVQQINGDKLGILCAALLDNTTVTDLDLSENVIDSNDSSYLVALLERNNNIKKLALKGNPIDKLAMRNLFERVLENNANSDTDQVLQQDKEQLLELMVAFELEEQTNLSTLIGAMFRDPCFDSSSAFWHNLVFSHCTTPLNLKGLNLNNIGWHALCGALAASGSVRTPELCCTSLMQIESVCRIIIGGNRELTHLTLAIDRSVIGAGSELILKALKDNYGLKELKFEGQSPPKRIQAAIAKQLKLNAELQSDAVLPYQKDGGTRFKELLMGDELWNKYQKLVIYRLEQTKKMPEDGAGIATVIDFLTMSERSRDELIMLDALDRQELLGLMGSKEDHEKLLACAFEKLTVLRTGTFSWEQIRVILNKSQHIQKIYLEMNTVYEYEHMKEMLVSLQKMKSLRALRFSLNADDAFNIRDEDMPAVAQIIVNNTQLTDLKISGAALSNDFDPSSLMKLLTDNKSIKKLTLSQNDSDTPFCIFDSQLIADLIANNDHLTDLAITNSCLNEGFPTVVAALSKNTTLTALDIHNNHYGPEGARALQTALAQNTTLTSLEMLGPDPWARDQEASSYLQAILQKNTTLTRIHAPLEYGKRLHFDRDSFPHDADTFMQLRRNQVLTQAASDDYTGPIGFACAALMLCVDESPTGKYFPKEVIILITKALAFVPQGMPTVDVLSDYASKLTGLTPTVP